jgi:hypothetical protein
MHGARDVGTHGRRDFLLLDASAKDLHMPEDLDDYEDEICSWCSGSGEGMYDGSTCGKCHGSGVEPVERDDEP